jgi:8-amino-7-oxononanoate synthase
MRERIAHELDLLARQSQFRRLEIPQGVNLCSNDYLGLAGDSRLRQALLESIKRVREIGSTGSRLLSGNSTEWETLEEEFAESAGTETALFFGSGYAANIGLLSSLLKPRDTVFSDALNHASLIDGIRLSGAEKVIYPHRDLRFLETAMRARPGKPGARLIVTESVFSMEGDVAPIRDLLTLAKVNDAELVVDEAHATGVCGPHGRGIVAEVGGEREVLAIVHTCGKALASAGALVCGEVALRDYLVNRARTFLFSTALPPYLAGQIRAALEIARRADAERSHLRELASKLRAKLTEEGLDCGTSSTHIVPVLLGTNEMALHVARELQGSGFAAKAIRPPTVPPGSARIRISLTSKISIEQVCQLADAIAAACQTFSQTASASAVHV